MYTVQENIFIIEAYFRSGQLINGEWQYSYVNCRQQFRQQFPNRIVEETVLQHHICRVIETFRTTGNVAKASLQVGQPRLQI